MISLCVCLQIGDLHPKKGYNNSTLSPNESIRVLPQERYPPKPWNWSGCDWLWILKSADASWGEKNRKNVMLWSLFTLQDSADCLHTFTYRMIKDWCSTYVKTSKDMHSLQKLKICHLVGGFNHLEKYESQWEGLSHILWKIKAMFQTTNQSLMFIVWKTNVATRLHMVTMSEFIP